jgi:hypothetical protein
MVTSPSSLCKAFSVVTLVKRDYKIFQIWIVGAYLYGQGRTLVCLIDFPLYLIHISCKNKDKVNYQCFKLISRRFGIEITHNQTAMPSDCCSAGNVKK